MRMWTRLAVVGVVCGLLAGCASVAWAPVMPPSGFAYTNTKAPLDIDLNKTQLGARKGEASSVSILGLVAYGDASTQAAATAGGLNTINHADYRSWSLLGIYSKYTTVVYGE
jgi:hypothetical protein